MSKQTQAFAERLRVIKKTVPFARHVVRTSDGESFGLSRPDWMLIDPRGERFFCYDNKERPHHLNVRQIVSIEPAKPKKSDAT